MPLGAARCQVRHDARRRLVEAMIGLRRMLEAPRIEHAAIRGLCTDALAAVAALEHAGASGQRRGNVHHGLARCDELLSQQPSQAAGALDRPDALRPGGRNAVTIDRTSRSVATQSACARASRVLRRARARRNPRPRYDMALTDARQPLKLDVGAVLPRRHQLIAAFAVDATSRAIDARRRPPGARSSPSAHSRQPRRPLQTVLTVRPRKKAPIASWVGRGSSTCGTCPQSSSRWRACGSASATCRANAIGTSVSRRPQRNRASCCIARSLVQKPLSPCGASR